MQSNLKYMDYYDRNVKAAPLKEKNFCIILQPKADNQETKILFRDYKWISPYVVAKVLPKTPKNTLFVKLVRTKHKSYVELD